jgi:hypothetical protein
LFYVEYKLSFSVSRVRFMLKRSGRRHRLVFPNRLIANSTLPKKTRSAALSSLGVLSASGTKPSAKTERAIEAALRKFVRAKSGSGPIPWLPPSPVQESLWSDVSALSVAWQRLSADTKNGVIRLQFTATDQYDASLGGALALIADISPVTIVRKRRAGRSVRLQRHHWEWPLRIGILPGSNSDLLERSIGRAFFAHKTLQRPPLIRTVVFDGGERHADVIILTAEQWRTFCKVGQKGAARPIQSAGLIVLMDESTLGKDLVKRLLPDSFLRDVPVVAIGRKSQTVSQFFDSFVNELAHDLPLDVALWNSGERTSKRWRGGRPTPVVVAGLAQLEWARTTQSLKALADRLARSPDVIIKLSKARASWLGLEAGRYRASNSHFGEEHDLEGV